jgi:hypothetical protein
MHTRKQVRFHRAVGVIPSIAKFFAKLSLERKPGAKTSPAGGPKPHRIYTEGSISTEPAHSGRRFRAWASFSKSSFSSELDAVGPRLMGHWQRRCWW